MIDVNRDGLGILMLLTFAAIGLIVLVAEIGALLIKRMSR